MIAEAMAERGWLRRGDGGRVTQKPRVPGVGTPRVYVVTAEFLAGSDDDGRATGAGS